MPNTQTTFFYNFLTGYFFPTSQFQNLAEGCLNLKNPEESKNSNNILKSSKIFKTKKGKQSILFDDVQYEKTRHQCFQGLDEEDMLTVSYQQ